MALCKSHFMYFTISILWWPLEHHRLLLPRGNRWKKNYVNSITISLVSQQASEFETAIDWLDRFLSRSIYLKWQQRECSSKWTYHQVNNEDQQNIDRFCLSIMHNRNWQLECNQAIKVAAGHSFKQPINVGRFYRLWSEVLVVSRLQVLVDS